MDNNREQKRFHSKLIRFKDWAKKHRLSIIIISGAVIISGGFIGALYLFPTKTNEPANFIAVEPTPKPVEKFYSSLTGVEVSDSSEITHPVTAVMIENSPEARPQSGLRGAGVVYEAVAEGGITRFLAIYQGNKPELIGPVRSLRYYYLNWAAPYQASIAHVGGSYNALQEVQNGNHRDIDQSFNSGAYWRSSDRVAPHNVYTSGINLDNLNLSKGYASSNFSSFSRTEGKPATEPTATEIQLNFSSWLFSTSYSYNKDSNSYNRSLAGSPHNDRESGQISPNVVIALEVETASRGGSDGYEDIVTVGSGKATIFQNGTATLATWHKKSMLEPLEILDDQNKPIELVRGQTWISAITHTGSISWQ